MDVGAGSHTIGSNDSAVATDYGRRLVDTLPILLISSLAGSFWLLFRPGLLSEDSVFQLKEALTWTFADWHPPAMSIVMASIFELGGSLASITLAQCFAAIFGMAFLVVEVLRATATPRPRLRWWLALSVLVILLLPWSPFGFYTMTLWKDAWAAVALLWTAAALLRLADPSAPRWLAALILVLGVILGLLRHNAIVVLPALGLLVARELRRRVATRWLHFLPLLLPLASLAVGAGIAELFAVRRTHPSTQVMALDLTGLCAASSDWCHELPYTRKHIRTPDLAGVYRPGNLGAIFWSTPPAVDPAIMYDNTALTAEYVQAVERHPLALLQIKLEAAWQLLGLQETVYPFHPTVTANPWHFGFDPRFAAPRARFTATASSWLGSSARRWFWGVHAVWLGLGVALFTGLLVARRRWAPALPLAGVLSLALTYACSYLAAVPVRDFRFLYPATLLVQGVALALLCSGLAHLPRARAPNVATLAE